MPFLQRKIKTGRETLETTRMELERSAEIRMQVAEARAVIKLVKEAAGDDRPEDDEEGES